MRGFTNTSWTSLVLTHVRKKKHRARSPEIWIQALTLTSGLCDPGRDNVPFQASASSRGKWGKWQSASCRGTAVTTRADTRIQGTCPVPAVCRWLSYTAEINRLGNRQISLPPWSGQSNVRSQQMRALDPDNQTAVLWLILLLSLLLPVSSSLTETHLSSSENVISILKHWAL